VKAYGGIEVLVRCRRDMSRLTPGSKPNSPTLLTMPRKLSYHVYVLVDLRPDLPLLVGKGKGL
jgi:hypothetical protein